jgi:hypothetical protein
MTTDLMQRALRMKPTKIMIGDSDNNLLVVGSVSQGKTTRFEDLHKRIKLSNSPAFYEWKLKLPKGSKLPRGKYFFWNKRTIVIFDEAEIILGDLKKSSTWPPRLKKPT